MFATTRGDATSADDRVFVYEVQGFRQNQQTENTHYSIRNSSSVFITVPYRQMNAQMQKITRMGGKIVSIHPASEAQVKAPSEEKNSG